MRASKAHRERDRTPTSNTWSRSRWTTIVLATPLAGVFACTAIVGVEDVRLRKTEADAGDSPDDSPGEDPESDGGEPPKDRELEVALGKLHTCARTPAGEVLCWGDDGQGQTGTGGADGGLLTTARTIGISDAVAIAAGDNHTCIIHEGGGASCWGLNLDGQLGNGQTKNSSIPVAVSGLSGATSIAAGANFTCALKSSGGVACWGDGLSGQLGDGNSSSHLTPSSVSNLGDAVAISAGQAHACAVTRAGKVACWGEGLNGQLGNGSNTASATPVVVPSLDGVVGVAAATRSTCALKNDGSVYCWGANELGQLGSGAANATPNPSPVAVTGLDATALFAGADHACAVRRSGTVACWGAGDRGQLGDGKVRETNESQPSPVDVSGVTAASRVGTGGNHSCATSTAGAIFCWGDNSRGQLGDDTTTSPQRSPVSVVGFPD